MAQRAEEISVQDLQQLMRLEDEDSFEVIDVRQDDEYLQGHIPGARHIPVGEVMKRLGELRPGRLHVFYCQVGVRSRVAAALARDSGLVTGGIVHLAGGMRQWDGFAVEDAPRVVVFADVHDMRSLLLRAIDMEKAAHNLYSEVKAHMPVAPVCKLMDGLISVEEAHARIIHRLLRRWWGAADGTFASFEEIFENSEGRILEGGKNVEELEPWIRDAATGDCRAVADLALEIEFAAYDLYRSLAEEALEGGALGDDAAKIFIDLARQEKKHIAMIIAALDQLGPEQQADAS